MRPSPILRGYPHASEQDVKVLSLRLGKSIGEQQSVQELHVCKEAQLRPLCEGGRCTRLKGACRGSCLALPLPGVCVMAVSVVLQLLSLFIFGSCLKQFVNSKGLGHHLLLFFTGKSSKYCCKYAKAALK